MFMKIDGSFECESRFTIANQVYSYSKAKSQIQLFRSNTTIQESQLPCNPNNLIPAFSFTELMILVNNTHNYTKLVVILVKNTHNYY